MKPGGSRDKGVKYMTQATPVKKHGRLQRLLHSDEVSVIIPLLAIMLITTLFRRDFLTVKNFSAMFTQISFIAIVALGASFTLMTGNVDISTGRVAGFAGILMATLCVDHGWSAGPAIIAALVAGALVGLLNVLAGVIVMIAAVIAAIWIGTRIMKKVQ